MNPWPEDLITSPSPHPWPGYNALCTAHGECFLWADGRAAVSPLGWTVWASIRKTQTHTHTHTHTHTQRRKRLIIKKPAIFFDLFHWAESLFLINKFKIKYHIQGWFYTFAIRLLGTFGTSNGDFHLYWPTSDCFLYIFFKES